MSKFPLPPNFFRCPALNVDETARLLTNADDISVDLVRPRRLPLKWTLKSDESSIQIYKGEDPDAPPGVLSWLGVTEVMATIEEVVSLFRSESNDEFKEYCRMFMKDVLDGQVLYNLRRRTAENPHHSVAIRWFALESPIPGIAKSRDWCFLETQHDFELDGKQGWTRAFKSVSLSCCPDLQNSLGLVRGIHHRSGYCFLQSNRPGYLQVTQLIQADLRGKLPDVWVDLGMKRRCRTMKGMDSFLRQKRLSQGTFLHDAELVPKDSRSKCFVCQRKFGPLSKKGQCRKCGEVVCRRCSQIWDVRIANNAVKRRVCTACSCDTVDPPADANTIVDDPDDPDDSQQDETPRQVLRQHPVAASSPVYSPSYKPDDTRTALTRQLSGLSITGESTPTSSQPHAAKVGASPSVHVLNQTTPTHHAEPFGGHQTPVALQRHPQHHRLPPASTMITLRKEDLVRPPPPRPESYAGLPEPVVPRPYMDHHPSRGGRGGGPAAGWDDDLQSVFKDDMSNYSESLVSFHQSSVHAKRGLPSKLPHHSNHQQQQSPYHHHQQQSPYHHHQQQSPYHHHQQSPYQQQGYDPSLAYQPSPTIDRYGGGPQLVNPYEYIDPYDRDPRMYSPGSALHASRGDKYANSYGGTSSQQYPMYAHDRRPPHQNQPPPRHQHHIYHPNHQHPHQYAPPSQRPLLDPRRAPSSSSHECPPYTYPPQGPPYLDDPRVDHPQYGYMQRQHQFLQDADGSSVFSHDDGATNLHNNSNNLYSTLYSYQPREEPPPAPRQASRTSERNDLILAQSSTSSSSPSVVLQTVFNRQD
ncbi:hypothetical protein DYB26_001709 [Aphanomyces astaci]|uniref:FYVE-type domain-containing protein n=5 Tax=Aphanomyces astaci TaxID=112090 RepID=A0A3R7AX11_APHAT|nr:hypothetical protein DYB26_001709 [Aphanomyces astaci]